MKRVVVLGTGTGVGKTFVSAALAQRLRELGADCTAVKPIESGYADPEQSDAHQLEPGSKPRYAFVEPISPHLAARRSGVEIDLAEVVHWVERISSHIVIVETAGGALTPLSDAATNLDLARALEPATLVLVAADALGVLHDVRACSVAMAALHRTPDYVVLSRSRPDDASTGTNAAELARLGIATCELEALADALSA